MDKETLSNYGWIVICVLVLAVMLALATPFGTFVADAIKSTTQGLFDVNQSALNSTGLINIDGQEFDSCDHDYEVTTTANCTTAGTTTHTCKLCGKSYSEETPAKHTFDNADDMTCNTCNTKFTSYSFNPSDYDAKMGTTTKTDAVVEIPETFTHNGTNYKVTEISGGYQNCTSLTSVLIPGSVKRIHGFAFDGCENLESVTLCEGLTIIDVQAFARINKLKNVTIPDSVTNIEQSAFANSKSIEVINISTNSKLKKVGICAFANTKITSIYFPDTVTSIGLRTFGYCYELTNVVLPAGLTSISEDLFLGCNKLKSVNIPEGVTSIGKSAFSGCKVLSSIVIPDGVQTIGEGAFYGCTSFESVVIPDNVTTIGQTAFQNCSGMTSLTIGKNVTDIGAGAFNGCSNLSYIKFNGTVEQWNAMSKGTGWNRNVLATEVVCSDGTISLS